MEGSSSINEKTLLQEVNTTPTWIPSGVLLPHRKYPIVRVFEGSTKFGDRIILILQDGLSLVRTSLPPRFMTSVSKKNMKAINEVEKKFSIMLIPNPTLNDFRFMLTEEPAAQTTPKRRSVEEEPVDSKKKIKNNVQENVETEDEKKKKMKNLKQSQDQDESSEDESLPDIEDAITQDMKHKKNEEYEASSRSKRFIRS